MQQMPPALQFFQDCFVGVQVKLAGKDAPFPGKTPPGVHRREHRQTVLPAYNEVLHAVARCGVHTTGALLQGNVPAQDYQGNSVYKGVAAFHPLQLRPFKICCHFGVGGADKLQKTIF